MSDRLSSSVYSKCLTIKAGAEIQFSFFRPFLKKRETVPKKTKQNEINKKTESWCSIKPPAGFDRNDGGLTVRTKGLREIYEKEGEREKKGKSNGDSSCVNETPGILATQIAKRPPSRRPLAPRHLPLGGWRPEQRPAQGESK